MESNPQARQIVVFLDGTLNAPTGGIRDSNVVLMHKLLCQQRRSDQLFFYCPGVGHTSLYGSFGFDYYLYKLRVLFDAAFGRGIVENIVSAYEFISKNYRNGDEIYIFGFSKGGFSAIKLTEFIRMYGLISIDQKGIIFRALNSFLSSKGSGGNDPAARAIKEDHSFTGKSEVVVHFLGIWDAVAAVGFGRFGGFVSHELLGARRLGVNNIRNAVAVNEYRLAFRPILFEADVQDQQLGHSIHQRWFPGGHADVGGGYPASESALSNIALSWMFKEAISCGLKTNDTEQIECFEVRDKAAAVRHDNAITEPFWSIFGFRQRIIPAAKISRANINSISDTEKYLGKNLVDQMNQRYVAGLGKATLVAALLNQIVLFLTIAIGLVVGINYSKLNEASVNELDDFSRRTTERLDQIKELYYAYSNIATPPIDYCKNALAYLSFKMHPTAIESPYMNQTNSFLITVGGVLNLATVCLFGAVIFAWKSHSRPMEGNNSWSYLFGILGPLSIYNFFSTKVNYQLLSSVDFGSSLILATILKYWLLFNLYILSSIVPIGVTILSFVAFRAVQSTWMRIGLFLCGSIFFYEFSFELIARISGVW